MTTRNLRSALLGSAVGVGLLASGGQAHALSTEFGELKIFFDTTVSVGVQMKTKDARSAFLTEFNGGNRDLRESDPNATQTVGVGTPTAFGLVPFTVSPVTSTDNSFIGGTSVVPFNFDDSPNTDDRFLNFGAGDLTSANIKASHDLQMTWRNFTLFARATEFYDAVLNSDGAYNRFGIDDNNREEVGRDIRLLDLYLSTDFDIGSLPVNFRAGKQVISWGEGTFIFNGINSINPVDVSTFRRPGVEIKEGLIPVWALYGSVGLPFDLSLEAFYQLDWEPFQLDPAGTPFAGSDVANANSSFGGNQGVGFYSGSLRSGPNLRNCDLATNPTAALANSGVVAALSGGRAAGAYSTLVGTGCSTASSQHYLTDLPTDGSAQAILLSGYTGAGIVDDRSNVHALEGTTRGRDINARDEGQWGVALRYYSEALNSTEFGFYYMKYHSRLPIAQVKPDGIAQVETTITGPGGSATNIFSGAGACGGFFNPATNGDFTTETSLALNGFLSTVNVADANATAAGFAPTAAAVHRALGNSTAASELESIAAGQTTVNMRQVALIKCGIVAGTLTTTGGVPLGTPGSAALTPDGTENIAVTQNLSTSLIYPEDIELWGLSFNTTIGDWGVQGEFSYRPNQPLQVDTTQQTITAAGAQCVGAITFGDALAAAISSRSTEPNTQPGPGEAGCLAANFNRTPTAFVREEVFTFQIGTTATYTNSNPLINFLGADIGILVTEFGVVHVPGAPDESPNTQAPGTVVEYNRLGNVCRSGTDLPLGAVLNLDAKSGCRPTETSYGGILLTRLDYNNAFGTPWTVSPQLVYRHDLEGFTPAPLGNYVEDRRSLGFSLTANLQNTWTVGLSYTDFMGSEAFQNNLDDDFVSLTASYSF